MHRSAACVLLLAGAAAACSSDLTTTPTAPTETITESFSGTVNRNGAATHPFTSAPGTLTATLRTLAPDSTIVVGLSLGTWNGTSCQIVLANDKATQGAVVIGNASTTTNLCARIYDVGSVVEPVSYQIDVVHN